MTGSRILAIAVVVASTAVYFGMVPQGNRTVSNASSIITDAVSDDVIAEQRAALAAATEGAGFGPQSPRDLDTLAGANPTTFPSTLDASYMNLCNIHFHSNAEHRGGEFTVYAGNGDGKGHGTGFKYNGTLSEAELAPIDKPVGQNEYGHLKPGDTIEIHFVYSSADVKPGPTLGACLNDKTSNPYLRVEAVVAVLVNDPSAKNMQQLAAFNRVNAHYQAVNLPTDLGTPVAYLGSTTGPTYNTKGSPYQVHWNVRPKVLKLDINSVANWLENNMFEESYAHAVRNLVTNPALISQIITE